MYQVLVNVIPKSLLRRYAFSLSESSSSYFKGNFSAKENLRRLNYSVIEFAQTVDSATITSTKNFTEKNSEKKKSNFWLDFLAVHFAARVSFLVKLPSDHVRAPLIFEEKKRENSKIWLSTFAAKGLRRFGTPYMGDRMEELAEENEEAEVAKCRFVCGFTISFLFSCGFIFCCGFVLLVFSFVCGFGQECFVPIFVWFSEG